MKRFALIGKGIGESDSPALFGAAYGGRYSYDLLDGEDFASLYGRFTKDYAAANVTAPFKRAAFEAADTVSENAELCGAANMLIRLPDGRTEADNSDFEGVSLSIMSACSVAGVDVDDEDEFSMYLAERSALVVGCGGAGKAAAAAAVSLGFGHVTLMNRSIGKAVELKEHLCGFFGEDLGPEEISTAPIETLADEFGNADFVIYTLPCACDGLDKVMKAEMTKDKFVLEANYRTPCLETLGDRCTYISGYNWLYNQAVVAYEAFTGMQPDEEAMKKAMQECSLRRQSY